MLTFKQIKLVGFKSFADKTVIPLSEGVTCIVGPNGCGKSNVADAIRWVLGEQSAKMMRGSQMMDVIFGGTEQRRMMSMCEVTLTFDNTSRIFDIDCDEVEMTRRLYRDGTSEYLLNREPSRMKVLTGLLHGAGAAKEGYSIIGQGRIEQIMNAKPEDRRSIFEEATGIVVFKDRKMETERKLAASRDNLYIATQNLKEIERQVGPLEKAAANAAKYNDLHYQIQVQEMNRYVYHYDRLQIETQILDNQNEALAKSAEELQNRSAEILKEYEEYRDKLNAADVTLSDYNERILRYEVAIEHKSGQNKLYTERATAVKNKLAEARDTLAFSAKRIDVIDGEMRRAESRAEKSRARIASIAQKEQELRANMSELSQKISEYEYMTGEHRKRVLDTFKDLTELRQNMGSLSAQKELLEERLKELEGEMEKIRARRDEAKSEYDECIKDVNSLSEFLLKEDELTEEAQNAVRQAEEKIDFFLKQIYDAEAQLTSLNDNLETYRALRDKFEGYIYSVKKLMGDSLSRGDLAERIMGLIADVVTCEKQYELAIETAFGGAMQNVITATREDAQYLIEYLKNTRSGLVTFLPIDAMKPHYEGDMIKSAVRDRGAIGFAIDLVKYDKKYENVIHNLLGNTLIVDTLDNARIIAKRYPRAFKIVTLDGDIFAVSGSMTGGSRREGGNLLANERRIKELEENINSKKSFLARANDKKENLERERAEAERQAEALSQRFRTAHVELAQLSEKQSALMNLQTSAESEYSAYGQSLNALKERLSGLDSEYSGVSRGASDLTAQTDEVSGKISDMSTQYDKLTAERQQLGEKINGLLVEAASLQSSATADEETVERLKKERADLSSKIDEITKSVPEIERQLTQINREAELSALTETEQKVVNELRKGIEETNDLKKQLNDRIKEFDAERQSISEKLNDISERQHAVEIEKVRLESDLERMRERVQTEYNAEYEDCLAYKTDDFDPALANSKIASLRRQISELGNINFNAEEEYKEVVARRDRKLLEKEDMEKAVNDLQTALDDIRAEMLKIFDEGFKVIGENFKRTFKELFGGGRAELLLDYTDCEDPLDAGVEIKACPPGKSLTKISLLSGGERALTAIAILFAIIGMRPMPFCVLDEIEAALDEANVARYAKYLKKFAQDTQFLVITHRKPTMENADTLFGVTMEEKGVSKIVSVKLSEVESRLGGDTVM